MPKVTMYYRSTAITGANLAKVGHYLRSRVSEMMSTHNVSLVKGDVDFIPIPLPKGSLVLSPFSFEIETIGFPERVAKFADGTLLEIFKEQLQSRLPKMHFQTETQKKALLIWLKYVSPDGPHV